jgi:hypothetical protein
MPDPEPHGHAGRHVKRFGVLALGIGVSIAVTILLLSLVGASVHVCVGTGC